MPCLTGDLWRLAVWSDFRTQSDFARTSRSSRTLRRWNTWASNSIVAWPWQCRNTWGGRTSERDIFRAGKGLRRKINSWRVPSATWAGTSAANRCRRGGKDFQRVAHGSKGLSADVEILRLVSRQPGCTLPPDRRRGQIGRRFFRRPAREYFYPDKSTQTKFGKGPAFRAPELFAGG